MKPLCILHAGTEKTGSTSLQHFLKANAEALAARGIWLPRALLAPEAFWGFNHVFLSTASHFSRGYPDDLQRGQGFGDMAAVAAHRAAVVEALAAEFAGLGFRPARIIVSSEHVHRWLPDGGDMARASALLAPYSDEIRPVVYLRRQDELARSVASMALMHGAGVVRKIPDFSPANGIDRVLGIHRSFFDYAGFLARLAGVFGEDMLDVRLYEAAAGHKFDVIGDFCAHAGIDMQGLRRPPRQNAGYSQTTCELLAHFNAENAARPDRSEIRAKLLPVLIAQFPGELPPASAAEAARFLEDFATGNESIRRKWFPARESLFAPVPMDGECPVLAPLSPIQAENLLRDIC